MAFNIGNVNISNNVVLAPMAGMSNPAYMRICEEMGVGYVVSELISSEAIVRGNKKTLDMLKGYDKLNIPFAVQLFGSNADVLGKASRYIEDVIKPDIIDINMGCPVPKVAMSGAGSGLLKDLKNIEKIITKVVDSVSIPVTVKIRSGWDKNSINAEEVSKICERCGAKAIAIHARTRSEGYSGRAEWDIIKKVKKCVNIPVIGNGDVKSPMDAEKMINSTGCDAVMIGRAALGNPWIIKDTVNYLNGDNEITEVTTKDIVDMIKKHLNYLLEIKSERMALLEMRTISAYYLRGIPYNKKIKQDIFKTKTIKEFIKVIESVI